MAAFLDEMLTFGTLEAAQKLGLTHRRSGKPNPRAVQRYIRSGRLRAMRYGRGYRVTGQALREFQEKSHVQPFDPRKALQ
jgi:hypothetical protein